MWKAVVFDLDGVLLDTEPLQYQAWVNTMKRRGMSLSEKEYEGLTGKNVKDIVGILAPKHGIKDRDAFIEERKAEISRLVTQEKLEKLPFADDAVAYFKSAGFKVAIATSTLGDSEMAAKVGKTGLDKVFGIIVTENDVAPGRGKPHPDIYLKAAEKLKLKPEDCIAIEDTPAGAQAAKASGMTCFAVPNKYTRGKKFAGADKVFGSLSEVMDYVKRSCFNDELSRRIEQGALRAGCHRSRPDSA